MTDNQSAMALMDNPVFHDKTKHIQIKCHFIREVLARGVMKFFYCPTSEMVADSLTKAVSRAKTEFCRHGMGVSKQ